MDVLRPLPFITNDDVIRAMNFLPTASWPQDEDDLVAIFNQIVSALYAESEVIMAVLPLCTDDQGG